MHTFPRFRTLKEQILSSGTDLFFDVNIYPSLKLFKIDPVIRLLPATHGQYTANSIKVVPYKSVNYKL